MTIAMTDPSSDAVLLADMKAAARLKEDRRKDLAHANADLADARKRLGKTDEAEAVREAKVAVADKTIAFARACDVIEEIERDLADGQMRLPFGTTASSSVVSPGAPGLSVAKNETQPRDPLPSATDNGQLTTDPAKRADPPLKRVSRRSPGAPGGRSRPEKGATP